MVNSIWFTDDQLSKFFLKDAFSLRALTRVTRVNARRVNARGRSQLIVQSIPNPGVTLP